MTWADWRKAWLELHALPESIRSEMRIKCLSGS